MHQETCTTITIIYNLVMAKLVSTSAVHYLQQNIQHTLSYSLIMDQCTAQVVTHHWEHLQEFALKIC